MDAPLGLLDRLCNPRQAFHAVRVLNTILFSKRQSWTPWEPAGVPGAMVLGLRAPGRQLALILPDPDEGAPVHVDPATLWEGGAGTGNLRVVRLVAATVETVECAAGDLPEVVDPVLVIVDEPVTG